MESIGGYEVVRLLGEGGRGKVYEGRERLSGRRVALKVLRPELTKREEGRAAFLGEMKILAHLEHENLVRSLSSVEEDGQLALVLEYLEGRTLRDEISSKGALSFPEALDITTQICTALAVTHGQEPAIVHRDLKPENVMLVQSPSGRRTVKVMDFGVAKVLEGAHATTTQSVGTLQYMSPEQIDARAVDARSDLYALGLLLYEMLSGAPPFHSASPRELLNLQCTTKPPPLGAEIRKGVPRGALLLLQRLLEKDPELRPASAKDVLGELDLFRSDDDDAPDTTKTAVEAARTVTAAKTAPEQAAKTAVSKAPRADTVDLIEARAGRQVPTWMAVALIVALSLVAGLTTYVLRLRTLGQAEEKPAATAQP
jgi:eukaryotic-like serine/threonine-protein kinase